MFPNAILDRFIPTPTMLCGLYITSFQPVDGARYDAVHLMWSSNDRHVTAERFVPTHVVARVHVLAKQAENTEK